MNRTLHITTTVLSGGRVVVQDPELSEGDEVHVSVSPTTATPRRSALEILSDSPGKQAFLTVEEADEYIREERDSWHR